jgi:hypothetical protein
MAGSCSLPIQPCSECPWRRDQPAGRFPPERYQKLANTAYDMSLVQFACHKSLEGREIPCAGFLLKGATHNLGVRLAIYENRYDRGVLSSPVELFDSFVEMAVFNGVDPEDPVLQPCRSDR